MKKTLVYLVLVLLTLSGCGYFDNTIDFTMEPFDEVACYTVDGGLTAFKTLKANTDPFFLDDKNVDNLMANADEMQTIETRVKVVLATGDKNASVVTRAFATIENYYTDEDVIELYLHKTTAVVDSLLTGQTYSGVTLTTDMETDINAYFDSVRTQGAEQNFVITDQMGKADFFKEVTRCIYGKTASIPTLEVNEKPYSVTCAAVEVMSLYSYLKIDVDDVITFYYDDYMSMRIWDADGNRIPMLDNNIDLEMAAEFGDRADGGSGRVLSKCVYDLEPGTYFVRWIRAESTKSAAQFTQTNPESETNYFKFKVGIFPESYIKDAETLDIVAKLVAPTITKELRSVAQCDSLGIEQTDTLWTEDATLVITDLARSAEKMNALMDGLDFITLSDFDQGIHLSYDQTLPQGLIFLSVADSVDTDTGRVAVEIDTLRIYIDGGSFSMSKLTREFVDGRKIFNPYSANVVGVTFREIYVSDEIENVYYLYNFVENLYIIAVNYDGDKDGINMVIKGS
ncbi:MAG: hypothetical protein DRP93_02105 [Candidatus Neomarinimicrobiota bacterium]|nr:MAG: hypothetical protein DRP93_02105 [Candidatus Neomarinimicrobiota bacterium]